MRQALDAVVQMVVGGIAGSLRVAAQYGVIDCLMFLEDDQNRMTAGLTICSDCGELALNMRRQERKKIAIHIVSGGIRQGMVELEVFPCAVSTDPHSILHGLNRLLQSMQLCVRASLGGKRCSLGFHA